MINTATLTLYTDERIYQISQYVTNYQIQLGLFAPYHQAQISLEIPLDLQPEALPFYRETAAFDLDAWCVISDYVEREDQERVVFLGRVEAVSYGIEAHSDKDSAGLISSPEINLTVSSFLAPLIESQLYLSGKPLLSGHIFDLQRFARLIKRGISSAFNRNVGEAFRTIYNELSPPYRFPKTLANGANLSQIPIISTRSRAQKFAPDRAPLFRSVFGLAINASHVRPTGAPWSILTGLFDADPSVIELYPSLEKSDHQGEISSFLGCTPVIVYRLKPFIFDHLSSQNVDPNAPAVQEHAARVAKHISDEEIISVGLSVSASDRVNACYVDSPLTESRGVEAFGLIGTPSLIRTDIERSGLRMYRAQWPFLPQGRATKATSLSKETQYIIDLVSKITLNNHRFIQGTAQINQRLDLKPGEWVKLVITDPHHSRFLVAYIENVSHSVSVIDSGVIIKRSSLSLSRGFYIQREPDHD